MNEQIAEELLLRPAGLDAARVRERVGAVMRGLDWADVYVQRRTVERWRLEEGVIKTGSYSAGGGIGLRAVRGETMAYASSDVINPQALDYLTEVAQTAKTRGKNQQIGDIPTTATTPPRFGVDNPLPATSDAEKLALLKRIDSTLRVNADVENVIAVIGGSYETTLIIRPDGVFADYRPLVSLQVEVLAKSGERRESGGGGGGGRGGYDILNDSLVDDLCAQALAAAREKLTAEEAPAGRMPVVLGPGWAGILLHEAVGHGLEGDFNRKKLSAFSGRVGEKVAADGVTVIDAGDIAGRRGSLSCDDEGTPTSETVLIENGVLRGYMQDITNARLMNTAVTGNGRRESYAHPPMPRMTNTFMPGGKLDAEEIIASVKDGIYAADFNGGEVDITNGNFVFVASRARRIKNGKLGAVIKGATLIGNGPQAMPLVSMIGNDFSLDRGIGMCGKDGQWVPVGVGQPTIKIDALTVGGTKTG